MSYADFLSNIILKDFNKTLKIVTKCIKQKKLQVLIAIPYENIQEVYKKELIKRDFKVEIINGKTPKKDREIILKKYNEGKIDILISYNVLKKGISIPQMGCLIDLYASTTKENIEQLFGRLNREGKNIKTKYFFAFTLPLVLSKQYRLKKKILKNLAKKYKAKFQVLNLTK